MPELTDIPIVKGGAERIPELEPLWGSLEAHHDAVAPELSRLRPGLPPGESWIRRRGLYEKWLAEPDAFVLVALAGSRAVGYALVRMGREDPAPVRVAELETLTLLPEYRKRGIGTRLIEAVYEELRRIGVTRLSVAVIASNTDAVRFYERQGLQRFLVSYIGAVPGQRSE